MRRYFIPLPLVLAGFLLGCPTVDLGEIPPDPGQCRPDRIYFRDVVWPQYIAPADPVRSCVDAVGCHRRDDGRSAFRMVVPAGDVPGESEYDINYQAVVPFLNCSDPAASSLLSKPLSGIDAHAGGDLFDPGSESATLFLQWFDQ